MTLPFFRYSQYYSSIQMRTLTLPLFDVPGCIKKGWSQLVAQQMNFAITLPSPGRIILL
jgi:hypothetical protein